jgi:hypothetical protein
MVPHAPGGGLDVSSGYADSGGNATSYFRYDNGIYFTTGAAVDDLTNTWGANSYWYGQYRAGGGAGGLAYGAVAGINYAQISYGADDGVYEAVGQFDFTTLGSGQLLAVAYNDDNTALPISAGAVAINAAAVPEPSAALLALLALGSTACARRRRHAVPR